MIDVKDLYDAEEGYSFLYDYKPMINAIGNPIIQVWDDDYQGDIRVMFEKDGKYGYLVIGFGSCSGCDALQACENYEDAQVLFNSFLSNTKWFDSLLDLKEYFRNNHLFEGASMVPDHYPCHER